MALKPADMGNCNPKLRCNGGVNDGVAYDPADPCFPGEVFDSALCDCRSEAGIYRITSVTNGTSMTNPAVTTRVYYANIPEPFVGTGGDLFRYTFVQFREDHDYSGSAFVNGSLTPDTAGEVSSCNSPGSGDRSLSVQNRTLTLLDSYCDNGITPPDGAGTGTGRVQIAAYNISNGCVESSTLEIQPTILWGGCATHRTAYVNYTIEYLGEGEFGDYVDIACLSGSSSVLKSYTC